MGLEHDPKRKLKLLGLHGFRTNGDILRRQLSKWSPSLHGLIDVDVIDAPLPCMGKSDVEGFYDGPYYEWYRFNKDYTKFYHVDEAIAYVADYMKLNGPYDGLIGFSQGAVLANGLAALQEKGMALQDLPPIGFVVLISPAKLAASHLKVVYEEPIIECPSLALLGEKDWMKVYGEELIKSFKDPVIISHRYGHIVPRLDEAETATVAQFLKTRLVAINIEVAPNREDDVSSSLEIVATQETVKAENEDTYPISTTNLPTNTHSEEVAVTA